MPKAIWNGVVIADSDETVVVEGNQYFPPESLVGEHFDGSETSSVCHWKGTANYYHVIVNGETNADAAWYYPEPKAEAESIRGRVAFWKGIQVS